MSLKVGGLVFLVCALASLPSEATLVTVIPSNTEVAVGDEFSIDIIVSDVADLYTVDLDILYDTAILDFVGFTQGDFLSSEGDPTFWFEQPQRRRVEIDADRYVLPIHVPCEVKGPYKYIVAPRSELKVVTSLGQSSAY